MDQKHLINALIDFLQTEPACQQILQCLSSNAEIGIHLSPQVELSIKNNGKDTVVTEMKAAAPDFIFFAAPDAISVLIAEKGLSTGQLSVKLLKQLISREIKVAMPTSIMQITRKGYLSCLKLGGIELWEELKKHGFTSVTKIIGVLGKLRKS